MAEGIEMVLEILAIRRDRILRGMRKRKNAIARYDCLVNSLHSSNVANDATYQRVFIGYYGVRGRNDEWRRDFFGILEREKNNESVCFSALLEELWGKVQKVELSFTSKLIATIDPNRPVYDSNVEDCLGLDGPKPHMPVEERKRCAIEAYDSLTTQTSAMINGTAFLDFRESFDEEFPEFRHFTDIKKLDLYLWCWRDIFEPD